MNKKKVFLFFPGVEMLGGAERRIIRSFCEIKKSDQSFEFVVGLLLVGNADKDKVVKLYKTLGEFKIIIFEKKIQLFNHVRQQKYDCVIYTDCSIRCLPVLCAATISKKRKIMVCANTLGSSQNLPYIKQLFYNFDLRLSDRIDCLYPYSTQLLQKKFKKKNITCTPCSFTDLNKYKPGRIKEKKIVFLGRIIRIKGADLFVRASIIVSEELKKHGYKCEIYGNGDMETHLKGLVKENNCEDVISFKGHIDNSVEILEKSMVFCSLQTYGNYPSQSLLEALACENYCIVTDTYDSKLLVPKGCGVLVEQDIDSIAKAIASTVSIPIEKLNTVSNKAREFIKQNHTLKRSAEYYKELIYEVIN